MILTSECCFCTEQNHPSRRIFIRIDKTIDLTKDRLVPFDDNCRRLVTTMDYLGKGKATDILEDYARAMFIRAGYDETKVIMADARSYHDGLGLVHCATNVIRVIPAYNWWETK